MGKRQNCSSDSTDQDQRKARLASIENVVRAVRDGAMVVLVDDEDRENEGDLIVAAEKITSESVNFMITHGKGLLCMPMSADRAAELHLPPMVVCNEDDFGTAVGLAESRLAMGDRQGAIEAYRCAKESIRAEDQRGPIRRERINNRLAELGVQV